MSKHPSRAAALSRRAALLLPMAALGGCSILDDWFGATKPPLPGKREAILPARHGLEVPSGPPLKVALPQMVSNAAWPQPGGNPPHAMGHLAAADHLSQVWESDIGLGGDFRRKLLAQPVVTADTVYTMDSDAVVKAFDLKTGRRHWTFDTRADNDRNTNVGGGIAVDSGTLYASTGRGELLALDATKGTVRWRKSIGAAARSSPTIADGRIFLTNIDQQLLAFAADDGRKLWTHQASPALTSVLGQPAPAYADGLVVAGLASGDLVAVRAQTGAVAWSDNLGAAAGRTSLLDLSAITGMPVIDMQVVYAISLGGLLVANDLRSGRRLWEREAAGAQTPWVAGDWLFLLTTDQQVAAVAKLDGSVAWLTQLPRYDNPEKQRDPIEWAGPVLVANRLVLAGTNGKAVAVSPYTGRILGSEDLPDSSPLAPVVAAGNVLMVTNDGSLVALR